jgi:hypothetical protein
MPWEWKYGIVCVVASPIEVVYERKRSTDRNDKYVWRELGEDSSILAGSYNFNLTLFRVIMQLNIKLHSEERSCWL